MVLPVKEVAGRDLALVCHFRRLPLAPLPVVRLPRKPSVNALAQEFVDAMQVLSRPWKILSHAMQCLAVPAGLLASGVPVQTDGALAVHWRRALDGVGCVCPVGCADYIVLLNTCKLSDKFDQT